MIAIRRLAAEDITAHATALAEILTDCIAGGAALGFLAPPEPGAIKAHFTRLAVAVAAGTGLVIAAQDGEQWIGMIDIDLAASPAHRHRVRIYRLMVHRRARRSGVARRLMQAVETEAAADRRLLTMDVASGSAAAQVCAAMGYTLSGVIPGAMLAPDATPLTVATFYKALSR